MCNMPGMVEAKKSLEPLEHVNVKVRNTSLIMFIRDER